MSLKVAVVTGSNKGVGYGIVKELCKRSVDVVYLTARDVSKGGHAVNKLKQEGLNPEFHQLDITDANSVKTFANYLKSKHGGLDILINNAAVISNFNKITFEDSKYVIDVNYRGLLNIQDYLFPLLKDYARVVNVSSMSGHLANIKNQYWVDRLINENIDFKDIDDFVNWFLHSVKHNSLRTEDFGDSILIPYKISKVAVCALTRVQQKNIGRGISINSFHPGFVKTDMSKNLGPVTIEQASKTPVFLVLDCDQSIKGKFFRYDNSEIDWCDTTVPVRNPVDSEELHKLIEASE